MFGNRDREEIGEELRREREWKVGVWMWKTCVQLSGGGDGRFSRARNG